MTTTTLVEDLKGTIDTLLTTAEVWRAKIYSNGWKKPGLGTVDVIEKAAGAKLGEIGIASTEDISRAVGAAREAQKEWAKVPGPQRGDVLREFSACCSGLPGDHLSSSARQVRSGRRHGGRSR